MPTSKKPGIRRVKKRRSTVAIGGTSQSAFAGYATQRSNPPKPPATKAPVEDSQDDKTDQDKKDD